MAVKLLPDGRIVFVSDSDTPTAAAPPAPAAPAAAQAAPAAAQDAATAAPAAAQPEPATAQTPSGEQRDVANLEGVPFTLDDVRWAKSMANMISPVPNKPEEEKSPDVNLLGRIPVPKRVNIPLPTWLGFDKGRRIKFDTHLPTKLMISGDTADIIAKSLASAYKDVPGGGFGRGFAMGAGGIRGEMAAKRKTDFAEKKKAYQDALSANQKVVTDYSSAILKERLKGKAPEKMSAYVRVSPEEKAFLERRGNKVPADNVVPRSWFERIEAKDNNKLTLSEQIKAEDALNQAWNRESKPFLELQDAVRLARVYKGAAPSNIGDNALVNAMAKFTDIRTGVRDAEREMWQKAQGLWNTWKNKISQVSGNGFLDPTARQQMMDIIDSGYTAALKFNLQKRKPYISRAKARGLDPDLAVPNQIDESMLPNDGYAKLGLTP